MELDPAALTEQLRTAGTVRVTVDGDEITLGPDDVIVTQTPKAGWTVSTDEGESVALEVALTPELRREGLAREAIRLIQDARKSDGLDVTDRIRLWWETIDPELSAALTEHGPLIAGEVLATRFEPGRPPADATGTPDGSPVHEHADAGLGLRFWLQRSPEKD